MRITLFLISISVFLVFSLAAGCTADKEKEIREEMVYYLVKMNEVAIENMDSESYSVGQELYPILQKLAKLRQVAVPALEWLELQSEELPQKKQEGSWRTVVTEDGLSEFKNDQYQISHLEFQARNIGEEEQSLSYVIKVADLTTNKENHMETIYKELEQKQVNLENKLESIGEKRLLSSWTLNGIIRMWQDWEVEKIDDTRFTVSGPGLGIAGDSLPTPDLELEEKLIAGRWTYHRDSREAVPADKQSAALKKILSGEF